MGQYRNVFTLSLVTSLGIIASCAPPDFVGTGMESGGLAQTAAINVSQMIVEPVPIMRFKVSLLATGTLRPGEPVQVIARVNAALATDGVEVTVMAPELEAYLHPEAQTGRVPVGVRLHAAVSLQTRMGLGEEMTAPTSITFPKPGYYRIALSARKFSREPNIQKGRPVVDFAYAEVWLLIDENGGVVTPTFNPKLLPDSVVPIPGLRKFKSHGVRPASKPRRALDNYGDSDIWRVVWYNPETLAYEALSDVSSVYWITDNQTGDSVSGALQQQTDVNGEFQVSGSDNWTGYTGQIQLINSDVVNGNVVAWIGGGAVNGEYYETSAYGSSVVRVFLNVRNTAPIARTLFSYTRPWVSLAIQSGCNGGLACYYPSTDVISINPQGAYGSYGVFVAAHEYGHSYHHHALGGLPSSTCPDSHYVYGYYNLGCGYREGFADFFAVLTRGDVLADGIWSDYAFESYSQESGGDGSIQEGAVASFLYDLLDGGNSPDSPTNTSDGDDDNIQYQGTYLADIVRTCQANGQRASGIDHLVYCLEQEVDTAVSHHYFLTRSPAPTSYSVSATPPSNWSRTDIRALWKRDLYGQ